MCQAAFTAAAAVWRACVTPTGAPPPVPASVRSSPAAASNARATTIRSGPRGRTSAGAIQTSQARAPVPSASARCRGTCPSRCGTKNADAAIKVRMTLPGGPIRVASQTILWTAATSEAHTTSSAVEAISDAALSATPRLATMPTTTHGSVRARAA